MSELKWTHEPLPESFDTFTITAPYRGNIIDVLGFVHDPEGRLEEPSQPVIIGAGNTYATVPYSKFPLQVARNLNQQTGMPVVGLETLGAHGKRHDQFSYADGYKWREFGKSAMHRSIMLTLADGLNLYERPLHHEGHSQSAMQPPHRTAATGPEDGLDHATATLFDPAGMRYFPRPLSLPHFATKTVAPMIIEKTLLHAAYNDENEFDPAILKYAQDQPELEGWDFLKYEDPRFLLERVGSRMVTPHLIITSLMRNPQMQYVVALCAKGSNGVFSTSRSVRKFHELSIEANVADRLHVTVLEKGAKHQVADVAINRAKYDAAHILGSPAEAMDVINALSRNFKRPRQ